jgi:hypothetical protein
LPAVEYLARQLQHRLSWELVDLILLLWLYSNPHATRRRTLPSLRHVLKHTSQFQRPDGKPSATDEELDQIVLAALQRLGEKHCIAVRAEDNLAARIELSQQGIDLIKSALSSENLQFLDESGQCT